MVNIRMIYFSLVLVLLVWGGGWLLYEFGGFYPNVSVVTWQNVLLVGVGVSLCGVVFVFIKPERGHEESLRLGRVPDSVLVNYDEGRKKVGKSNLRSLIEKTPEPTPVVCGVNREDLEKRILASKPESKERRELLKQWRMLD